MSGNSDKQPPLGVYKCKELIHDIFLQSGQKDLLMAHIRHKASQQGWTWTMRDTFFDYIKKTGVNKVNVSHMMTDLSGVAREQFPNELKKELAESIYEVTKDYFTIDDSVTPITDPDNENSERTFLFQSKDIKPDPGLGVGLEPDESPPPSPQSSTSASSTPRQSPEPVTVTTPPPVRRPSPLQNNPRQSPGSAPKQSLVNSAPRPLTPPQSLPPPPILRPEPVKAQTVVAAEDEELEEDDDDDFFRYEEDEEEELMDV